MAESLKKINYLTEEQYQEAKENGQINENEIYMTPDDEIIYNNTNYSTEEIVIGKWFGKPLYRKTIVGTNKLPSGYSSIDHGVDNIGQHKVFKEVEYRNESGDTSWTNTYSTPTGFIFADSINSTAIGFNCGSAWNDLFIPIVTIEYTKTTD